MARTRILILVVMTIGAATAWGQTREPQIGYLYPGGAQRDTVVQIIAGGQFLRGASAVHVSGDGVQAKVIKYMRPVFNINREQRVLLQNNMKEVRQQRLSELFGKSFLQPEPIQKKPAKKTTDKSKPTPKENDAKTPVVKMPEHPLLYDLENKSLRELAHLTNMIFFPRNKRQQNRQLAESVLIEITIDADAMPGDRELRIQTNTGLTNPMVFQVGLLPEVRELEPNNKTAYDDLSNVPYLMKGVKLPKGRNLPRPRPLDLPVLLNGQIMPGDVDRFRFRARQGQQLVIQAHARSLIPYLADAVPGWFQATLALYDANGNEVAYADDYQFHPDPVLVYQIKRTGEYELEIRDAIYRGREDFVYRVAVGELPFITRMFPLGGKAGVKTIAELDGWNLDKTQLPLDTQSDGAAIRRTSYYDEKRISNSIPYAVNNLPECKENESNNSVKDAQRIHLPKIINGHINQPGDVDVFEIKGRAGDNIVAEIYARRLNSPLDSILRLTDASGTVLSWNDDYVVKDTHLHKDISGLLTHHADSYLLAELPKDGTYYVHLADTQHHGGEAYGYRLRLSAPQPDFALRVTPSHLHVNAGGIVPVTVHALRKDGFDGPIEITLKNAPAGFTLQGARIPRGSDQVRITLTAPAQAPPKPIALQLEGRVRSKDQIIRRPALAADDTMQAFLYRHLVPSQELLVAVKKIRWRVPHVELAGEGPVCIPTGGSAQVKLKTPKRAALQEMRLVLREPPEGVSLHDVKVVPEGLAFQLKARKDSMPTGFSDNLIVEAFREYYPKQKDGKPAKQKQRYSMGVLPAIPIKIVP